MNDLERVYEEKRFCQVWVPQSDKSWFKKIFHGRGHLIRGRLTEEEANEFVETARKVKGQEKAKVVSIFK